jgi:hypothetical protein
MEYLVHIFCYNFRSILFSIIVKICNKYTKLYVLLHIKKIYVHCVDVLI